MKTITRHMLAAVAVASLGSLAPQAASADAQQAIGIAANHAGLAAKAANINAVHTHLHHVLNCLVGPGGEGFDAMPGNPCAMAGGAIPQENNAAEKTKLLNVAAQVRAGIGNNDENEAKKVATDAQTALK